MTKPAATITPGERVKLSGPKRYAGKLGKVVRFVDQDVIVEVDGVPGERWFSASEVQASDFKMATTRNCRA